MAKIKKSGIVFLSLLFISSISMGALLGWALSETKNIENSEYISEFDTALPTKLLDINGEVITEFASDEKREIISYQQLPQHLIDALITREDRIFFSHKGFCRSIRSLAYYGHLKFGYLSINLSEQQNPVLPFFLTINAIVVMTDNVR